MKYFFRSIFLLLCLMVSASAGTYIPGNPDGTVITSSASGTGVMPNFPISTAGYNSIMIVPNITNGNTLSIEGSNDNSLWWGLTCLNPDAPGAIITSTILAAPAACSNNFLYVRVRLITYVTGTTTVTAVLRQAQVPTALPVVIGANAGTSAALPSGIVTAATSLQVKASAGNLYSLSGSTGSAAQTWIMLLDQTATPTNGSVTPTSGSGGLIACLGAFPANSPFSINYSPGPVILFVQGLWVVASSTGCSTLTLTTAASLQALDR